MNTPNINIEGQRVVYARALLGFLREHRAVLRPVRSTLCGRAVVEHWTDPVDSPMPVPVPCLRCSRQLRRGDGLVAATTVGRWWAWLSRKAGARRR